MQQGQQKWGQLQQEVTQKHTQTIQLAPVQQTITEDVVQFQSKSKQVQHQKRIKKSSYRADIDGLRTIAITIVIIFHAYPEFMPGGFIGVDVFFVISGFLISQIIIKETKQNRFSYVNFYSRRIRRIYPALITVLAFVLYVVPKYYKQNDLFFTLKTLNASVIFGANFQIMMHEKDYFDSDVKTNPLLHLWSLGVEEQFYIFWPCLIAIGIKIFQKRTLLILGLYTACSFIFGIYVVYRNPKYAFYFPICRFWQMSIGGLIAYFNYKVSNIKISNALSVSATLAILITVWIINEGSLFPGFWALIPTLASAFIIQAGNQAFINKYILSNKFVVFIGKISYPIYLWHWPLLVFSRYLFPEGSTSIFANTPFIILLTTVLSILTYFLVEKPIRKTKSKIFVLVLLLLMILVGSWSYLNIQGSKNKSNYYDVDKIQEILRNAEKQYAPQPSDYVQINGRMQPNLSKSKNRMSPTVQKTKIPKWTSSWDWKFGQTVILQKRVDQSSKYYIQEHPPFHHYQVANQGKQNQLFLIGDSHAQKIGFRFQKLFQESVAKNTTDKFPTIIALANRGQNITTGKALRTFAFELIKKHQPKRVFFNYFWGAHIVKRYQSLAEDFRDEGFQYQLEDFFQYVKQLQSMNIEVSVTSLDIHSKFFDPNNMADFYGVVEDNLKPLILSQFRKRYKKIIDLIEPRLREMNVQIINQTDNLCWNDICQVTTPKGYAAFYDADHVAKFTARHWLSCVDHLVQF